MRNQKPGENLGAAKPRLADHWADAWPRSCLAALPRPKAAGPMQSEFEEGDPSFEDRYFWVRNVPR